MVGPAAEGGGFETFPFHKLARLSDAPSKATNARAGYAPLSRAMILTHTHSLSRTYTHMLSHTLSHCHTHTHTHTRTLKHTRTHHQRRSCGSWGWKRTRSRRCCASQCSRLTPTPQTPAPKPQTLNHQRSTRWWTVCFGTRGSRRLSWRTWRGW